MGRSTRSPAWRAEVTTTIRWLGNDTGTMVAPAVATQADRQVIVRQDGIEGPVTIFELADRVGPGDAYQTTSMVPLESGR